MPSIPPLEPGALGTEPLPGLLMNKLRKLVETRLLAPNDWPTAQHNLTNPMVEDEIYENDPMLRFYPANSGSLTYSEAKTQYRPFVGYRTKCGILKKIHKDMLKMWNTRKIYAVLKGGHIAVAPNEVVAKTLPRDMDVQTYILLAKTVCLKMESSKRHGKSPKAWKNWFVDDENDRTTVELAEQAAGVGED